MDTKRTIEEIEVALALNRDLGFYKGLIIYNIVGWGEALQINHECDMLVCNKSGYLTEIEIKRSFSDFCADLKKPHRHEMNKDGNLIKYFFYCIPQSIYDKCVQKMIENDTTAGFITYDEDLHLRKRTCSNIYPHKKMTIEQIAELGRLASLKVISAKRKIAKLQKQNK